MVGIGPSPQQPFTLHGHIVAGAATKPLTPGSLVSLRYGPPPAKPRTVTGSAVAEIVSSTKRYTRSLSPGSDATHQHRPTGKDAQPRENRPRDPTLPQRYIARKTWRLLEHQAPINIPTDIEASITSATADPAERHVGACCAGLVTVGRCDVASV